MGFDPGFEHPTCLATLKSSDRTKQSVCGWQYVYIYIYIFNEGKSDTHTDIYCLWCKGYHQKKLTQFQILDGELQWTKRTRFFIKIYLSHFILERVDVGCVWEVSWRRGQTATYWPKVLLTIAALLSQPGWAAKPCVTEGPSPLSGAGSHSAGILSPSVTGTRTPPSRLWHLVI